MIIATPHFRPAFAHSENALGRANTTVSSMNSFDLWASSQDCNVCQSLEAIDRSNVSDPFESRWQNSYQWLKASIGEHNDGLSNLVACFHQIIERSFYHGKETRYDINPIFAFDRRHGISSVNGTQPVIAFLIVKLIYLITLAIRISERTILGRLLFSHLSAIWNLPFCVHLNSAAYTFWWTLEQNVVSPLK